MEKIKIIGWSIFIAICIGVFAVCGNAQEPKEIVFGHNAPFSGPAAMWGTLNDRAIKIGAKNVNDSGGFTVGGQKYIWKVKIADSGYVPSTAVANARYMIQEGIKFMNSLGGSCAAAVAPITEAAQVLTLNNAGGGSAVTKPEYKLTFRYNWDLYIVHMGFYAWLAKNRQDVKTVASINPDDETGWDSAKGIRKGAEVMGLKIVAEEFYPRSLTDFFPLITKIMAKKPDLIDFGVSSPGSSLLLTIATGELNYRGVRVQYIPNTKLQKEKAGKYNNGAYATALLPKPITEMQKKAYNDYMAIYPPKEFDPLFYQDPDLIPVLTKAIVAANSFDTIKVAETLRRMKFDVCLGPSGVGGKSIYGIDTTVIIPAPICLWENEEVVYKGLATAPPGF